MSPVMRFEPGAVVTRPGTYALVGHYGEPTNVAVRLDAGERLPAITLTGDTGPLWFIEVDEAHQAARAS